MAENQPQYQGISPALIGPTKYLDRFRLQAEEAVSILRNREMAAAAMKQTTAETAVLADFLRASKTSEGFDPFSEAALPKAFALTQTRFAPLLDTYAGMEKIQNLREASISDRINAIANLTSAQGSYAKATSGDDMTYNDALSVISDYEAGESKLPVPNLEESIGAFRKRTGMNLPESHNNPGNILYGDFAAGYGAKSGQKNVDGDAVALFRDVETGKKAMADLLVGKNYRDLPFDEAMKRYSGFDAEKKTGYGSDVLDILTPSELSGFGVDPAAIAERKMSDLAPEERQAVTTAMMKREGFGARKGEVGFGEYDASIPTEEYSVPEKVRKAYRLKDLHENKEASDRVKDARANLRGVYTTLTTLPEAKRIYERVSTEGVSSGDMAQGDADTNILAAISDMFSTRADKAALLAQVRGYAAAIQKRQLYEGLLEEWGGSYRDLISKFGIDKDPATSTTGKTAPATSPVGTLERDKDGNFIWNGPKPK
jgi:hypothetical protein